MELIVSLYAVFTLVVALACTVDLFHPVIKANLELDKVERAIYYFVLFILAMFKAPFLVYPCLNVLKGIEFRDALSSSLFSK